MTARPESHWAHRRRGVGLGLGVLALHLALLVALWQTMQRRTVDVTHERAALLLWTVREPSPTQRPVPPAAPPAEAVRAAEPRRAAPARPLAPARESTWVSPAPLSSPSPSPSPSPTPAPALAATPSAPDVSASAPPTERLMDTAATREAIRQTGQKPLLHERVAEATGTPIERTDTALARGIQEAANSDCLKDPKAASGQIGPIALGGILGLPFLAARAVTGRCAR